MQQPQLNEPPARRILLVTLISIVASVGAFLWLQRQKTHKNSPFYQSLTTAPPITFRVVNMRVDEESKPATQGTCRQFTTAVTVATQDPLFSDRPASLELLVRDSAPKDADESGGWVVESCNMFPVSLDAKSYGLFEEIGPRDELRNDGYTASCTFKLFKSCFDSAAGGDYEQGIAVERTRPQYKLKLLSWSVADGIRGTLLQ